MARITLLGVLLLGAAILFITMKTSATEVPEETEGQWDMRQEIQDASDTERNGWRREMDV